MPWAGRSLALSLAFWLWVPACPLRTAAYELGASTFRVSMLVSTDTTFHSLMGLPSTIPTKS